MGKFHLLRRVRVSADTMAEQSKIYTKKNY